MTQEIKYDAFTANTSDYECGDGELAASMNLLGEDGTLKPVLPPKVVFPMTRGLRVLFIHKTADYTHYIIHRLYHSSIEFSDGTLDEQGMLDEKSTHVIANNIIADNLHQINAIGNTLILLTKTGMMYYIFREGSYAYIGNHIPELDLKFYLEGELRRSDLYDIGFKYCDDEKEKATIYEDKQNDLTSAVMAQVNKFIVENSTNEGRFIFPFFVRYAYRLYDGTLTMHSAPILMTGMLPQAVICMTRDQDAKKIRILGVSSKLFCNKSLKTDYDTIVRNWKDIISSIDIFISAPIYTHDQAGTCTKYGVIDEDLVCYATCYNEEKYFNGSYYSQTSIYEWYKNKFDSSGIYKEDDHWSNFHIYLPERDVEDIRNDVESNAQFYLLKSIKLGDTIGPDLEVPEDYLQSLVTREVMTDDYDSHDTLIPKYSFGYNSRFNIANLQKSLFEGFNLESLIQNTRYFSATNPSDTQYRFTDFTYFLDLETSQTKVSKEQDFLYSKLCPIMWLFYPNNKASFVKFTRDKEDYYIPLKQHPTLNGAYAFNDFKDLFGLDIIKENLKYTALHYNDDPIVSLPNKLYTSEINNPFYFPLLGINTVGTGEIKGICAAAKALSQGQFGQFPLYVFATDGVWAMEVSSTGTYSARQPITRDVCVSSESITQLDSEVAFATDRGIMLLSGSNTICISDEINSRDYFTIAELPLAEKLMEAFNAIADNGETETADGLSLVPFSDFIKGCRMVYDYVNQRLIAYNPSLRYAYIYSIKSKRWGMMKSYIVNSVNSYPEALATVQDPPKYYFGKEFYELKDDGKKVVINPDALVDFSHPDAESVTALAVTRPLKLGAPDVLKTVDTVIQRGYFRRDHVAQVLYGSRDLFNWDIVWDSRTAYLHRFRGTPYKYFRLALICKFDKAETLYGCTVQFTPRFTNHPR